MRIAPDHKHSHNVAGFCCQRPVPLDKAIQTPAPRQSQPGGKRVEQQCDTRARARARLRDWWVSLGCTGSPEWQLGSPVPLCSPIESRGFTGLARPLIRSESFRSTVTYGNLSLLEHRVYDHGTIMGLRPTVLTHLSLMLLISLLLHHDGVTGHPCGCGSVVYSWCGASCMLRVVRYFDTGSGKGVH